MRRRNGRDGRRDQLPLAETPTIAAVPRTHHTERTVRYGDSDEG